MTRGFTEWYRYASLHAHRRDILKQRHFFVDLFFFKFFTLKLEYFYSAGNVQNIHFFRSKYFRWQFFQWKILGFKWLQWHIVNEYILSKTFKLMLIVLQKSTTAVVPSYRRTQSWKLAWALSIWASNCVQNV